MLNVLGIWGECYSPGRPHRPPDITWRGLWDGRDGLGKLTGGIRVRSPHRFALIGLTALAMLAAGCSGSSSSSSSGGGANWSTSGSASAGGGMSKLIAAAKQEGTLNAIALPPTRANYAATLITLSTKYALTTNPP